MMHMCCFIRDSRKADALFTENSIHRKLSFREARLSETGLPRITVVGSSVHSSLTVCAALGLIGSIAALLTVAVGSLAYRLLIFQPRSQSAGHRGQRGRHPGQPHVVRDADRVPEV